MEIPVLIERVNPNCYRARSGEPLPLTAEGSTHALALANLHELLKDRLNQPGTELTSVDIHSHPLITFAGSWSPDDKELAEWQQILAENRQRQQELDDAAEDVA